MMGERSRLKPQALAGWCTSCGTCVDQQCPVGALALDDEGLPQVDADTCITCFCCQEVCPEKALSLR